MSSRLAFVRHGAYAQRPDTPSALQPFGLTAEGEAEVRQQARQFALWLEQTQQQLDPEIDSSTLLRAWQTAQIYAEELAPFFTVTPEVQTFPALCERSVGAVANLTIAEIEAAIAADPRFDMPPTGWKSDSFYRLPFDGAESLMDAGMRVAAHILSWQSQTKATENGAIKLFVGHGASIRHAACHLNVIKFCDIKRFSMHYGHPIVFDMVEAGVPQKLYGDWKHRQLRDAPD
ncbi:histidine phosphatase family protein [Maribrevibacterium harenarium]|uniref:Histidine phosphatase family protein n=1 Tax=Maribrevibacterium harenarium TaxID=2589817 RepID=A0A501X432_9GAMM|nr:histidine phosphatase family protein [Maribrevibacterium harenarium]TPE55300.1 histidine phosphatase family protein [Maribrevibacterium harenarium]